MARHETCDMDEIYLGNTPTNGPHQIWLQSLKLNTLRFGTNAYDIFGHILPMYSPIFIHRNELELYDDAMMTRTFGPYWRQNR